MLFRLLGLEDGRGGLDPKMDGLPWQGQCAAGRGCYCLLSLDTLWASQFTLVFQLSRRASLNFTRKCFSASSSVFPNARES